MMRTVSNAQTQTFSCKLINTRQDTLAVYEALAGTGVLKADLVEREADRVKQEQAQRQKDSANGGWGS